MRQISSTGRFAYIAATAAVALALVDACSDAAGEMLVDAGTMLADAGGKLADSGMDRSDAGQLLREAGQALADAGESLKDSGNEGAAQTNSGFKSGSRIEMRRAVQMGADGSQFAGYSATPFDKMLNVACNIQRTSDGKLRCVPAGGLTVAVFYAAGCTQPLAYMAASQCDVAIAYALKTEAVGCASGGPSVRVYSTSAYAGKVYSLSGTTCVEVPADSLANLRLFAVGSEVPAATFVEFTAPQPTAI